MNPTASVPFKTLFVGASLLASTAVAMAADSNAGKIKQSEQTGPYTIRLEILPPEPFVDPSRAEQPEYAGQMVNGKGASPIRMGGPKHPNHHMAVFVMRDGHVVEDALIHVRYKESGSSRTQELPVSVMWVAGTPRYKTTHFGNNVYLADKAYDIEVKLNHRKPLHYHVDLGQSKNTSKNS